MTTQRRAPKGYTFDPCPGCGGVDEMSSRPKLGVCRQCRTVLDGHARHVADLAKKGDALFMYGVPEAAHWLPYLTEYLNENKSPIQKGFWNLAIAVSEVNVGGFPENGETLFESQRTDSRHWFGHHAKDYRLMPKHVAENLRTLFNEVKTGLTAAYTQGKSDGSNLLAMLNSGELTTSDFERRAGIIRD